MSRSSRVLLLLSLLLGLTGIGLGSAPVASAHDRLVASSPADGTTVAAPTRVTLTYSAEVLEPGARISVVGPDGAQAIIGEPTVEARTVTQAVRPARAGRYVVTWRVTSGDGHPISGRFSFTVARAATSTASSPAGGLAGGEETATEESRTSSGASSSTSSSAPPFDPGRKVDTDATRNRPWLILGLSGAAVIAVAAGAFYAKRRLRDDE